MRTLSQRIIGKHKRELQKMEQLRPQINFISDVCDKIAEEWLIRGYSRGAEVHKGGESYIFSLDIYLTPAPWDTPLHFNLLLEWLDTTYGDQLNIMTPELRQDGLLCSLREKTNGYIIPGILLHYKASTTCEMIPHTETVTREETRYEVRCK